MMNRIAIAAILSLFAVINPASADEGKDESGKGSSQLREYTPDQGRSSYFHQHGYTRIPNGHLPPPGECRIWYPNRPAGQQPPPFKCGASRRDVELGGWMISPGHQPEEVEVVVYDQRRPGLVIDVGIFDSRTGAMIRVTGSN